MRRWVGLGTMAALALAGCGTPQQATPLPNPAVTAMHEWDHGPPWDPEELPWVTPPQILAGDHGYWGPGYWGPSVGIGLGFGVGRAHRWRGHPSFHGPGFGGPRHVHGGRHGRR